MTPIPPVVLGRRGAEAIREARPFVQASEIIGPLPQGADVVQMQSESGKPLGTALVGRSQRIALRLLCRQGRLLDEDLFKERITQAETLRRRLFPEADAYRVVHAEADGLPGLFVDRYGSAAVIQTVTWAMDRRKPLIAKVLAEVLGVDLVVARDDGGGRDFENLPRQVEVLLPKDGARSTIVTYRDAGSLMTVDLLRDGKTGGYLDQQENHHLAGTYAGALFPKGGKALDAFTYHGGFALALGRAGLSVLACDENPAAVSRARENVENNGLTQRVEVALRNAFDLLRELEAAKRQFEVVVIDPPALAKRGQGGPSAVASAIRAYKELNLRGLRLLGPGGLLVTSSCSARVSPSDFEKMLAAAAKDAGAAVQILERRGSSRDHPVLLSVPETEYLKCFVLRKRE